MKSGLFSRLLARSRDFAGGEDGATIVMVAVGFVVLTAAAGLAFDGGRGYLMKSELTQAVDAAALAGGRSLRINGTGDYEEQIRKYFSANLPDGTLGAEISEPTINLLESGNEIEVSASAVLPTTLMRVLSIDELTISARTVVNRSVKGLEIALVLDNSGSMEGAKLSDLKNASTVLMDILYGNQQVVEDLYVSLVPFTARTNLKGQDSLIDVETTDDDGSPSVNAAYNELFCFDQRNGAASTDDTPANEVPFDLYSGTFNPDASLTDYQDKICPSASLLPLWQNKSDVKSAIDGMAASGCTRYDIGTAWGWRVLSPKWQGTWEGIDSSLPQNYEDQRNQKAVIVMTDGQNTPDCAGDAESKEESEAMFLATCQDMKSEGVTIYTITFQLEDEATNNLFQDCASGDTRYFKSPNGEQLEAAFAQIANDLSNLRISQ